MIQARLTFSCTPLHETETETRSGLNINCGYPLFGMPIFPVINSQCLHEYYRTGSVLSMRMGMIEMTYDPESMQVLSLSSYIGNRVTDGWGEGEGRQAVNWSLISFKIKLNFSLWKSSLIWFPMKYEGRIVIPGNNFQSKV